MDTVKHVGTMLANMKSELEDFQNSDEFQSQVKINAYLDRIDEVSFLSVCKVYSVYIVCGKLLLWKYSLNWNCK